MRVADRDENGNLTLVKAADGGPYSRCSAADVIDPADGTTVLYSATTPCRWTCSTTWSRTASKRCRRVPS